MYGRFIQHTRCRRWLTNGPNTIMGSVQFTTFIMHPHNFITVFTSASEHLPPHHHILCTYTLKMKWKKTAKQHNKISLFLKIIFFFLIIIKSFPCFLFLCSSQKIYLINFITSLFLLLSVSVPHGLAIIIICSINLNYIIIIRITTHKLQVTSVLPFWCRYCCCWPEQNQTRMPISIQNTESPVQKCALFFNFYNNFDILPFPFLLFTFRFWVSVVW